MLSMNQERQEIKDFIIGVDFDNTLFVEEFPVPGAPMTDYQEVVQRLYYEGFIIIINTLRRGHSQQLAEDCLQQCNVPYDLCNENARYLIDKYGDSRKICADIYLDDRNAGGLPHPIDFYNEVHKKWKTKQLSKTLMIPCIM
jgi:hypothetical protein